MCNSSLRRAPSFTLPWTKSSRLQPAIYDNSDRANVRIEEVTV